MFPNFNDNCLLGGVLAIDKIKFVKNHWEHPDGTPIDYEKKKFKNITVTGIDFEIN